MHAPQPSCQSNSESRPLRAETDRLIIRPANEADCAGEGLDLAIVAKTDNRMIARWTFRTAGPRNQEAQLLLWLDVARSEGELMVEAARVAVPMAMRFLGTKVLRADARADDEASIGLLRRLGMRPRGSAPAGGMRVAHFEKDLCGIM